MNESMYFLLNMGIFRCIYKVGAYVTPLIGVKSPPVTYWFSAIYRGYDNSTQNGSLGTQSPSENGNMEAKYLSFGGDFTPHSSIWRSVSQDPIGGNLMTPVLPLPYGLYNRWGFLHLRYPKGLVISQKLCIHVKVAGGSAPNVCEFCRSPPISKSRASQGNASSLEAVVRARRDRTVCRDKDTFLVQSLDIERWVLNLVSSFNDGAHSLCSRRSNFECRRGQSVPWAWCEVPGCLYLKWNSKPHWHCDWRLPLHCHWRWLSSLLFSCLFHPQPPAPQ